MNLHRRFTLFVFMLACHQGVQGSANTNLQCTDWEGKKIAEGSKFKARLDPCETCICEGGHAVSCYSPGCAAPPDCKDNIMEEVEGECCLFNCIKPADLPPDFKKINNTIIINSHNPTTYEGVDNANLGLRLVASTVTSFLILALLLFMVHRLRQRRILIMMRRINEEQSQDEAVAYMSHFDHYDMGIEFPPYEDPPPPYTPHKPQDIPLGEAPPPYQANLPNNNNNIGEGGALENGSLVNGTGGRPLQGSISRGMNTQYWLGGHNPSGSTGNDDCAASDSSLSNVSTPSTAPVSPSGSPIVISYDNFRTSGSRVMVSMENNSPRTSVVQGADRRSGQAGSEGAADRANGYVHRSNSVEIKVGSCNPRNSYSHVNVDETAPKRAGAACASEDDDDRKGPGDDDGEESQGEDDNELAVTGAAANGLGGVNLSWNRGIRPQRIAIRGPSGFASSTASSPSSTCSNSPDPGAGAFNSVSRQASNTSDTSSPHNSDSPSDFTRPVVIGTRRSPVATWGPLCSIDKPRTIQRNNAGAPSHVSPSMQSPIAVLPEIGRSASMTSQFSVCSETGEKRPKMSLPMAIANDAHYPDMLFNRFNGPEHPEIISPGHASGASGPSTPGEVSDLSSPVGEGPVTEVAAAGNPTRRTRPRISYVDMNCNNVSNNVPSEAAAAGPVLNGNVGGPGDLEIMSKVNRSGSQGSRQDSLKKRDHTQEDTKNTTRKSKLKNQKSKDNPANGELGNVQQGTNRRTSPEGYRRVSKPKTEDSSTYKQYGFVDGPERISRKESSGSCHGRERSAEKSRDSSQEKRREGSREKTDIAERRERSQERRGKSKERTSSSRNNSNERLRNSSQNRQTRNRSRSSERTKRSEHRESRDTDANQRNSMTNEGYNDLITNADPAHNIARMHSKNQKDSRPLERHPTQHSASLERRHKRRPEDGRYIPEASQVMAAILTNSHSAGLTNDESCRSDWNQHLPSKNYKSRSHVKDHHQRSIPLMSSSWSDVNR